MVVANPTRLLRFKGTFKVIKLVEVVKKRLTAVFEVEVATLRGCWKAEEVAVINPGLYKLVETPSGVVNADDVPVMKPGRYKLVETLRGVVKAVEVPVIKFGR